MTKILFIGAPLYGNLGGPSLLISTMEVLNNFIPDAEFTLLSSSPINNNELSRVYDINIAQTSRLGPFSLPILIFGAFLGRYNLDSFLPLINKNVSKILNEFKSADVIIDIWGIMFADNLGKGSMIGRFFEGRHFLIGKLLKKPVIKYTADFGPFRSTWTKFFGKFYLNMIDLILARGDITKKRLIDLGIVTPIQVCPDTAFMLKASVCQDIRNVLSQEKFKNRPVIGISVSHTVSRRKGDSIDLTDRYISTMAQTADYVVENLKAIVILIPNEIFPNRTIDDTYVATEIYKKVDKKDDIILVTKEYPANELKGIIRECDLLIGSRYHSIIAALSMCIPTIVISWHHKYHQVMGLVGQKKYICDIETLDFAELKEKIDDAWTKRDIIRSEISSQINNVYESILSGGRSVKELLESKSRRNRTDLSIV